MFSSVLSKPSTSTPQQPFKTPQIPSNRDQKAVNRGTLGVYVDSRIQSQRLFGSSYGFGWRLWKVDDVEVEYYVEWRSRVVFLHLTFKHLGNHKGKASWFPIRLVLFQKLFLVGFLWLAKARSILVGSMGAT